jgi:1,2-dihydroxy-3-keto-5-methylthiopentene dioxygenase
MVAAYYFDASAPGDQRAKHQYTPNRPVSLEDLKTLGIEYKSVDVTKEGYMEDIEALCKERNYANRDLVRL